MGVSTDLREEAFEHLFLAGRLHSCRIEDRLDGEAFYEADQLVGDRAGVQVGLDLPQLLRLADAVVQDVPEPLELIVLEVPQALVAEGERPEVHFDLRLEEALLV